MGCAVSPSFPDDQRKYQPLARPPTRMARQPFFFFSFLFSIERGGPLHSLPLLNFFIASRWPPLFFFFPSRVALRRYRFDPFLFFFFPPVPPRLCTIWLQVFPFFPILNKPRASPLKRWVTSPPLPYQKQGKDANLPPKKVICTEGLPPLLWAWTGPGRKQRSPPPPFFFSLEMWRPST